MQIQGKIIQSYPLQSGESTRGVWKKKEFVIETYAKIPKKVCLSLRGESAENLSINVGDSVKVSIDIESREHNGRWYTEARAWKVEPYSESDSNDMSDDTSFDSSEDSF